MHFDHIDTTNKYLPDVLSIIRNGIATKQEVLELKKREGLNTQTLVETFNIIGTSGPSDKPWIGVQKEHERKNGTGREDIYFHLNDDHHTRIFYVEAKRLPKYRTNDNEEYIIGDDKDDKKSGGIQRYKLLVHGDYNLNYNGMIAFIESKTVDEWVVLINNKLKATYPEDIELITNGFQNEYTSTHKYENHDEKTFIMHHFWINLAEIDKQKKNK